MPTNYRMLSYLTTARQRRSVGIASNVVPINPTQISGLKLWHAVRLETGYSNGNALGTLLDFSGNGNKATQGTAANKPTYTTGGPNSQPYALFDTSNDEMTFDSSISLGKDYTVIIVMARTASGILGMVAGGSPTYWGCDASNVYHNTNGTYSTTVTTITTSTFYLLAIRRMPGSLTTYKNGAAIVGSIPGDATISLGSYIIFTGGSVVNGYGMNLCECLIYDSCISTNDLSGLFAYLNGIYALY